MRQRYLCAALLALAGCTSDPLSGITRLSDVEVAGDASVATLIGTEEETKGGFFAHILARGDDAAADGGATPAPAATEDSSQGESRRGGLLGLFQRDRDATGSAPAVPGEAAERAAIADKETQSPRRGLFGFLNASKETGVNAFETDAAYGMQLPYGEIARVCDAPRRNLGQIVARHGPAGKGGMTIHDSAPGGTGLRAFFITGFADGCPRQVTAALVMFGSAGMHESLRYGLPAKAHPYSRTDDTYERIKARVCRVGPNKPCGDRLDEMERRTVFISVYEKFSGNPSWADVLLHDGAVVAQDFKGG